MPDLNANAPRRPGRARPRSPRLGRGPELGGVAELRPNPVLAAGAEEEPRSRSPHLAGPRGSSPPEPALLALCFGC